MAVSGQIRRFTPVYSWDTAGHVGGKRETKKMTAIWALPGSPSGPVVGGGRFPIQAHDWLFKDHASSNVRVPHPPTAQDKTTQVGKTRVLMLVPLLTYRFLPQYAVSGNLILAYHPSWAG